MTLAAHRILIIEDEAPIRKFLEVALLHEGYRVSIAADAKTGMREAVAQPPELIILDLGLPDRDGQQLLPELREWYQGPILILSARDQEPQKIAALDAGADDYLTKPFGIGELLARIRVALRHANSLTPTASQLTIGPVTIDLAAHLVYRDGQEVHLTPLEFKLLATLIQHAGKVLTHRFLLKEVWGPGHAQENHYLRVFVAGLRRKLETDPAQPQLILTEPGVGYRMASLS